MKNVLFAAAAVGLVSCSEKEKVAKRPDAEVIGIAKEAAGVAFGELSGALGKAIAEGGPVRAIPVCSSMAGPLTREVAARQGLEMVRLSDRPRNPAQRAKGEDLAALEAMKENPRTADFTPKGRKRGGAAADRPEQSALSQMPWRSGRDRYGNAAGAR